MMPYNMTLNDMMPIKPKIIGRYKLNLAALALVTGFALSACGSRGTLKTPPPIWGDGITAPAETPADTTTNTTGTP